MANVIIITNRKLNFRSDKIIVSISSWIILIAVTLHFHGGFTYIYKKRMERHTAASSYSGVWKKPLKTNERNMPHPVYDILGHSRGCAINIQYTTDGTFSYIHRFQYSKFSRLLSKKRIKQICLLLTTGYSLLLYRASNQRCKGINNNWKQGGKSNIYSQFNKKVWIAEILCKPQKANNRR